MSEEEIAAVRRLSGRFQGNVHEEIAAYNAAGDNWMMKTVALWDLIATILNALEAANRDRASVRREALLEAAKATCLYCGDNMPVEFRVDAFFPHSFEHKIYPDKNRPTKYHWEPCTANPIHSLIADED